MAPTKAINLIKNALATHKRRAANSITKQTSRKANGRKSELAARN